MKQTKAQKRIALAKDVLAKLKAKEIVPGFGSYLHALDDASCQACALGSMVAACCKPEPGTRIYSDGAKVIECLSPLFAISQLALIEAAFEGDREMPMMDRLPRDVRTMTWHLRGYSDLDAETRIGHYECSLCGRETEREHGTPRERCRCSDVRVVVPFRGVFSCSRLDSQRQVTGMMATSARVVLRGLASGRSV